MRVQRGGEWGVGRELAPCSCKGLGRLAKPGQAALLGMSSPGLEAVRAYACDRCKGNLRWRKDSRWGRGAGLLRRLKDMTINAMQDP